MVTMVSEAEGSKDRRVKQAFFIVEPNQKQLAEVAGLITRGRLRAVVDAVVPLARAAGAHTGRIQENGRGNRS